MSVSFSDLQRAFEFVSSGGMGENEAYLDRQSGKTAYARASGPPKYGVQNENIEVRSASSRMSRVEPCLGPRAGSQSR